MKTISKVLQAFLFFFSIGVSATSFDVCPLAEHVSGKGEWFGVSTDDVGVRLVFVREMDRDILEKDVTQRQLDLDDARARARATFRGWFGQNVEKAEEGRIFVVRALETTVRNCRGRWLAGFRTDAGSLSWATDQREAAFDLLPATKEFLKRNALLP